MSTSLRTKIELRNYQVKSIQAVKDSIEQGETSGLLYLATGLGKTVIASALAKELNKKTLFIVHREELAIQTLKKMLLVYPEATVGIVQGKLNQLGRKVTIASIQTLTVEKRLNQVLESGDYELIIVDECFPKGTLVDGKPIETLKEGDFVSSFNHKTNQIELRPITKLFKKKSEQLIKINTKFGKEIICTLNHPFYTRNSYIPALLLKKGDLLYVNKFNNQLQALSERISNDSCENETSLPVYRLFQKNGLCFLQSGMSESKAFNNFISKNDRNQFKKERNYFSQNENKQPFLQSRNKTENKRYPEINTTQTQNSRGKWERFNSTSTATIERIRGELGNRICSENKGLHMGQISLPLQNRYSEPNSKNSNRSRWKQSQCTSKTGTRFKKREFLSKDWVESIEILEQGSIGKSSKLYENDYVYNIEVENNNNYFANGLLVHNCHHYSNGEWKAVIDKFNGYKIGLTATPNRSDNIALNTVFNRILYRYSIVEGIKNKHLVDIEGIRYKLNANFDELSLQNGDYSVTSLSGLMKSPEVIMETYKAWETYAKEKKTIVFCVSIDHVNSLTDYFQTKNISAKSLIGETSSEERAKIYADFESGKIQVLISCMVLTEGFDEPSVECVLGARPTISESLYIQMIGRGLRKYPNKEKCLVIDLVGNSQKHRVMQLGILFGLDQKKKEKAENLAKHYGIEPEIKEDWNTIESVMAIIGTGEKMTIDKVDDKRNFEWVETEKGLVLSLGYKYGFILIEREEGINFHKIVHFYSNGWKDKKDELADSLPLDWAITIAEREALRFLFDSTNLVDKNSAWRLTEPSQKQIDILKNLGCNIIPMTKGKASDLITKLLTLEKINGYDLAINSEKGKKLLETILELKNKEELKVALGNKKPEKFSLNECTKILFFHEKNKQNNF